MAKMSKSGNDYMMKLSQYEVNLLYMVLAGVGASLTFPNNVHVDAVQNIDELLSQFTSFNPSLDGEFSDELFKKLIWPNIRGTITIQEQFDMQKYADNVPPMKELVRKYLTKKYKEEDKL